MYYKHNNEAPKVWTLSATKHYLAKYNLRPKEQAIYTIITQAMKMVHGFAS